MRIVNIHADDDGGIAVTPAESDYFPSGGSGELRDCGACDGAGADDFEPDGRCRYCGGSGERVTDGGEQS